ncbi:MAG: cation diffusion facilitator family transporter, partial [Methanospirillum sp.]|uniref:cation diffusion facilitator family transporter n=1 Tax=Methanospirillum sp. TaxID=45200 RepID=UPI0023738E18
MKIMAWNKGRDPVPGCDVPQTLREKQHSLQASLGCQIIILLLKICTTVAGGSLTQISDLFRSCADILSIIFSIGSLKKTSRGKNDIYQYGYGKLESLASLTVALVILISCFIIGIGMVLRVQHPSPVGTVGYGVLVSIFSIGVNGYFLYCNHQISKKEHSPVMESQWRLFRVKVFANVSVIVILILSMLFRSDPNVLYFDLIGSVIVCCFMLSTAYHLLISSVYELIDGALE